MSATYSTAADESTVSPLDRTADFSRFPDDHAFEIIRMRMTLREFEAHIRGEVATDRDRVPWFVFGAFGDDVASSPSGRCYRHKANFLHIDGVELDFDNCPFTPLQVRHRLRTAGLAALIYTTPSHGLPGKGNRLRVFLPCSRSLPPAERYRLVARVNGLMSGKADDASFSLSQGFRAGSVRGRPIETWLIDGRPIDEADDLDAGAKGARGRKKGAGGGSTIDEAALREAIRTGASYHPSAIRLVGKWATQGVSYVEAQKRLRAIFNEIPEDDRDPRWGERVGEIPRILAHIYGNQAAGEHHEREGQQERFDEEAAMWADIESLVGGEKPSPPSGYTPDDDGMIRAFVDRHAAVLRFDHDLSRWFRFEGHWREDRTKLALAFARDLSTDRAKRDSKAKGLRSVKAWEAVERGARADRAFAVTSDLWNANPMLLGTPGGTVDLQTGKLRRGMPGDYISRVTAAAPIPLSEFNAERDCPTWLAFLAGALQRDADAIRLMQQWGGYSLTGATKEQKLLFVYGPGGSGKGTAINTIADVLGDYAANVEMATLTASKHERHSTELARLRGARMARASETEKGKPWAENLLKLLTGQDKITARFMRQDNFEFLPEFKLTLFGNNRPSLRDVDDAIRRRFIILPFTHKPAKPDPDLGTKLRAEWPGILSWLIVGCLDWQANGLAIPEVARAATDEYFAEQDIFGQWLDERCERGRDYTETTKALRESWTQYAHRRGVDVINTLADDLQKHGFTMAANVGPSRDRGYRGLRIRSGEREPDERFG